jgi:pyruvate,orthophosphate dikinase
MKTVYYFGGGVAEGKDQGKERLGGKGAGLHAMTALGIPVPPGFTITTEVCTAYYEAGRKLPAGLMDDVRAAMARVESEVGARFGDPTSPLLVSVRSGARASMPGMMDTILNLGLNPATCEGLARATGNPRFVYDSYRRFIAMFGDVVLGLKPASDRDPDPFEEILELKKRELGRAKDLDLGADDLADVAQRMRALVRQRTGADFPDDPWQQLERAIASVFDSWHNPRAETYRRMYGYPASWGTAANVQAMVFGNMGADCATGVAFTRDPSTGEPRLFGEFLPNAQGEDVVAGTRTPLPIAELGKDFPAALAELREIARRLEAESRDMQDVEFTVQRGKLWMLQTRNGKRSGRAMVRIAVDQVKEGLIDRRAAILRLEPGKLDELLHPTIDRSDRAAGAVVIGRGLPASPGAAIGRVVFTAGDAEEQAARGEQVILVRVETSPEDIHGMKAAQGIVTSRGGMTSHAAVVARGMGKPCVVGAGSLRVDPRAGTIVAGDVKLRAGDVISIDGSSGEIMAGRVPLVPATVGGELAELMTWVDEVRRLRVRTNADTPIDARTARAFGAEGIGLCRTEHMFFEPARILAVRQMILASTPAGRREALEKILPMQRGDFEELFRVMDGLPVTIRLLDPPLHEFLPKTEEDVAEVAAAARVPIDKVRAKNHELVESNPMLGHRGCRLAVTFPEIYETQVRAIAEAAATVAAEGKAVHPEIMIPIVGTEAEITSMRALVERTLAASGAGDLHFAIGTMIELPRACVVAAKIAAHADFFSFGTNDLTQTTFGFSRDDVGEFLPAYLEQGLLAADPFVVLDREGVGRLVALAVEQGRKARPGMKMGICGEHGGEPSSVEFFDEVGLDYVSCSPFRVPIAQLAAAQAVLRRGNPAS